MSQLAIARRYRPRNFQAVVGQEITLRSLTSALDTGRLHHAYLFTGTRGVGKTTLARILAKCLNCERGISSTPCETCTSCVAIQKGASVDLLEVDAASRTKVEDTRELLDNVQYLPTQSRFKIYLIDEVHMLSGHSFNALLKTLEEPPAHVKFILATTDPQKLPITVLSRCLQFHLQRLPFQAIVNHLKQVLTQENILFEETALPVLARAADGSMRDALSLLEQAIAYGQGQIHTHSCRSLIGLAEQGKIASLFSAIVHHQPLDALQIIRLIANAAPDFSAILTELLIFIHHIAVAQQAPEALDDSVDERDIILELARKVSLEEIQLYYQIGLLGQRDLPLAPSSILGFEMIILRMLAFQPLDCAESVNSKEIPWKEMLTHPSSTISEDKQLKEKAHKGTTLKVSKHEEAMSNASASKLEDTALNVSKKSTPHDEREKSTSAKWFELVSKLNLSGITKELASHCSVVEWLPNSLHLNLEKTQQALLNPRSFERLQTALSEHSGVSIKLRITQGDEIGKTPARVLQKNREQALSEAKNALNTDPNVQEFINRFNANVEEISTGNN